MLPVGSPCQNLSGVLISNLLPRLRHCARRDNEEPQGVARWV
jgi:hypothetical protein